MWKLSILTKVISGNRAYNRQYWFIYIFERRRHEQGKWHLEITHTCYIAQQRTIQRSAYKGSIKILLIHYPATMGSSNYLEQLTILLLNEVDCLTCITPLMSVNSRNTFIQMAGIQGFEHFLILQGLNDRLISIPNVLLKSLIMLLLHLTFKFTGICWLDFYAVLSVITVSYITKQNLQNICCADSVTMYQFQDSNYL